MKIVVFGATGRVGRKLVAGGIVRGHAVTPAARRPGRVRAGQALPRIVACDILDGAQVGAAIAGQEAVVVVGRAWCALLPATVHSEGIANVIAAMKAHAVRRLVCVSAAGTQDGDDPNLPPLFTHLARPILLGRAWSELRAMEAQVRASGLDWTLVHVARLTEGPALGHYRAEPGFSMPGGRRISRADVADFMLKELERDEWVRRDVALAY